MNLTGVWEDENAIYFVRSTGAYLWWLSEEGDLAWVHAFHGLLDGNRLHGKMPTWRMEPVARESLLTRANKNNTLRIAS